MPPILTLALDDLGYDVVGIDIQPERFSATLAKFEIRVDKADVEQERWPFPNASFDVVIFNEVIEHLRINPVFAVAEIARILRPGGLLLLSTPNLNSRRFRAAPDIYKEYHKVTKIGHMGHFRIFSPTEIINLLARFGFKTETIVYRSRFPNWARNAVCRVVPQFRPRFSLVSVRLEDV